MEKFREEFPAEILGGIPRLHAWSKPQMEFLKESPDGIPVEIPR